LKLLYLKKDFIEASGDLKKFYREKELEYVSDELNNLYVAFTRAEEELYIFLTDRIGQSNRLIPYLFALEPFQSFTSDERITIGERRKRTDVTDVLGSSGDATSFFANFMEMPGWTTKLRTRLSDMDSVGRHAILARKKGNAIHRALSLIQFLPVDKEMIAALARAASAHEGIEDQSAGIESVLRTFFATPSFATFFTPGPDLVSWNEKEIVDGNGNTFKIDRIVAGPDRVDIIDYKTGETHCESHFEQIRHYGKLIAEALPAKEIRLHLLYIDDGRVVEA
ncbi:MAG: PD-(D/E)XK nuclease family protein, partial [Syntrophorhabdus sp.]